MIIYGDQPIYKGKLFCAIFKRNFENISQKNVYVDEDKDFRDSNEISSLRNEKEKEKIRKHGIGS